MLGAIFHVTTGGGTCKISSDNHWKSHIDHTEIENEFFSKTWLAMNEKVVYKKYYAVLIQHSLEIFKDV
jgi:Leu/Phe-tRNA-protein transferase